MVKIEAIIQPFKFDEVRQALECLGVAKTLIHYVMSHGDGRIKAYYRGAEYPAELPRIKIELLAPSDRVDEIVSALMRAARTSAGDDGMILVFEVADAIRIHNGAHLQYTLA